jgi:hypothetical protein
MKKNRSVVKRAHKHHVHLITAIHPKEVHSEPKAVLIPLDVLGSVAESNESHAVLAVPESLWKQFKTWLAKEFK